MTTVTWIAGSGDWKTNADWSDDAAPNDLITDALFAGSTAAVLSIAGGESYAAHSLTIGSSRSTVSLAGTLTVATGVSVTAGTLVLSGGLLAAGGTQNAALNMAGGFSSSAYTTSGTLQNISVLGNVSVPNQIELTFAGNTTVYADTSQTTPGTVTAGYGTLDLAAAALGTVTAGYSVTDTVGQNYGAYFKYGLYVAVSGSGTAEPTLVIAAGAVFTNTTIESANAAIGSILINDGTLTTGVGNQPPSVVATDMVENFGLISGYATIGNTQAGWTNEAGGVIDAGTSAIALLNSFSNAGTIEVGARGSVQIGSAGGTWINTGQITSGGGIVLLEGNETAADIGSLSLAAGTALAFTAGTLDNAGGTLGAGTPSLHGLDLFGGTIEGGEVDAAALGLESGISVTGVAVTNGFGVFAGVAIIGGDFEGQALMLAGGSAVYTDATESTLATIDVSGYGSLAVLGSALTQSVIAGDVTIDTGAITAAATILAGVTVDGSGVLESTYAPGNTEAYGTLVNDGVVAATVRSFPLAIYASDLTNQGALEELGPVVLIVQATSLVNDGLITNVGNGNVQLNGALGYYGAYDLSTVTPSATNAAQGEIVAQSTGTIFLQNGFVNAGAVIAAATTDGSGHVVLPGTIILGTGPGSTWTNTGQIEDVGGVVLLEGDETVADLGSISVSNGGTLALTYGTLENAGGTLGAALAYLPGLMVDGSTIKGGVLNATGLTLTVGGQFANQNPNSNAATLDGVSIVGAPIYGIAAFVDGTAAYTDTTLTRLATIDVAGDLVIFGQSLTQSVVLGGGGGFAGNTGTATAGFTIAAGATISGSGYVDALSDGVSTNGGALDNLVNFGMILATGQTGGITINSASLTSSGTIAAASLGTVAIDASSSFTDTGLVSATGGGTIQINTALTNFLGNTLSAGSYLVGANSAIDFNQVGSLDFNQVGGLQTDAASITLSGTNAVLGVMSQGSLIALGTSLTKIAAGATLALAAGATLDTSNTFTNDGTIMLTGGSTLSVGGFINNGTLELDATSSFIDTGATNGGSNSGVLVLNGGTYTSLVNASGGMVAGYGVIAGPVSNDGTITVSSGVLRIEGSVTGTGSFVIDAGADLELNSGDAENVAFTASGGGQLVLAETALFTGGLSGLAADDSVDFGGAAIAGASEAANGGSAELALALDNGGSYDVPLLATTVTGDGFTAVFDGNQGTQLTALPNPADTGQYTSTMPGSNGGVDRDPKLLAFLGYGPNGTQQQQQLAVSQDGVNFALRLPVMPLGDPSVPFYLSALNQNQGSDVDSVYFQEEGGGEFVTELNNYSNNITVAPGIDSEQPGGAVAEGPAISVLAGGNTTFVVTTSAGTIDLPVETLTIYAPASSDTSSDDSNSNGSGDGDVHLTSFDGLHYGFQEVGEFVLAKSTALGDDFQVQIRLQPLEEGASVSVTTALAVQLNADRVTFDPTRVAMLWVDGEAVSLQPGGTDQLADGKVTALTATSFSVALATGELVTVDASGGATPLLNYSVQLAGSYSSNGNVTGLLGNDDGNPANDIQLATGTVLAQPLTEQELYQEFGNSWRVTDPGSGTGDSSLLDYGSGQDTGTFTEPNFPQSELTLAQLPASVLQAASAAVAGAGLDPRSTAGQDALLDYALTGNIGLVTGDGSLPEPAGAPVPALQIAPPTGATTPAQSYGIAAQGATASETASGGATQYAGFTVYATQTVSAATTLDWSVVAGGGLTAVSFGGTLPSGTVTIAQGGTLGSFSVALPAGLVGGNPSDTLMVQLSDTDGSVLTASAAQTVVGNAQPVAGTPAQAGFILAGGGGTLVQDGNAATIDLGQVVVGSAAPSLSFAVGNQAASGADALGGSFSLSGDGAISVGGVGGFGAVAGGGLQGGILVTLDTSIAGEHSETITLDPSDGNASGYVGTLAPQTLTIDADVTMACFAAGTRIMTPRGAVAVEALAAGDAISTAGGMPATVVWVGHRRIVCRRHPRPHDVWPVRVLAGAFGADTPQRDLLLSPDHAVFVDGSLIPVRYLINGRTIVQQRVAEVTYHHVELARHDVLLAEGLPCESYLDTGNRSAFSNGGKAVMLHPDFAPGVWQAQGCAPLVLAGPVLHDARRRLLAQAAACGHRLTDDPRLQVRVDGGRTVACFEGQTWHVRLPPAARSVRLVSSRWVPAWTRATDDDTSTLGVAIGNIRVDGQALDVHDLRLSSGWHPPEATWRWTDGDAGLALGGGRTLSFNVVMSGLYWATPLSREADSRASIRQRRCLRRNDPMQARH